MTPQFWNDFNMFLAAAQGISDSYMKTNFPKLERPNLDWSEGKRYIKVFREDSVHCFVDKTNGNILKAASWKAPAKHARGNIHEYDNGAHCMSAYGTIYLR